MVTTNDGLFEVAKWFNSETANPPTHFAVGTGSTAVNVTDSSLDSEELRDAFDSQSRASNLIQFDSKVTTVEATGSTLTEVGIFNSSSGGVMFSRNLFTALEKTDEIEIQIESRTNIL